MKKKDGEKALANFQVIPLIFMPKFQYKAFPFINDILCVRRSGYAILYACQIWHLT